MTKLLDLAWAVSQLLIWIAKEKKTYAATSTVETSKKTGDQRPVEEAINGYRVGSTTADLPSVRVIPAKDHTRRNVEDRPVRNGDVQEDLASRRGKPEDPK